MTGFGRLLRAEWVKLRSVRRWAIAMAAMVVLSVGLGLLTVASSSTDVNRRPFFSVGPDGLAVTDQFQFVHQTLTGDGSIQARVVSQKPSHDWAGAGVMFKDGTRSGSAYAALMLTPGHGVRLGANFSTDIAGPAVHGPRWLKLTREGQRLSGYESTDGQTWRPVGTVTVRQLPDSAEVGLFVSSPGKLKIERSAGGTGVTGIPTTGQAVFDAVSVAAEAGSTASGSWHSDAVHREFRPEEIGPPPTEPLPPGKSISPDGGGSSTEVGGVFTVTGTGAIARDEVPDDLTQATLFGILVGLPALIAVGVLFVTSEYRRGLIRTTFAAVPQRGRVLAAKAVVLGGAGFALGLIASVTAFVIGQPIMRSRGFAPPAFAMVSLTQLNAARAVIGTAVFVALVAVLGLAIGTILRRSAGAITAVIALVILPIFVAVALPATAARWLLWLTPAGGFAVQRAKPPTDQLAEPWSMINPWAGIGTVTAYAAAALAVAIVLVRRRDA